MIKESSKSLIAENKDVNITLSAFMVDIVRNGLKTLKTLKEFKPLLPYPSQNLGNHAENTIMKSKTFQ